MAIYKRDGFGHIIPKNKINSTKGTWYVDKMIRGKRYRFAVPEATTRRQAERAEAKLKTEIFEMEWRHVDFQKGVIEIPRGSTKSGKGRIAVMNRRVKDALAELRGDSQSTGRVFPFSKHEACKTFSRLCKDIGLSGVTFHTCRHSFSSRLAEANVNPFTARDLMGHEDIHMTGYYTHTAIETMREAVTRLERASNRSDFAANLSQSSGEKNVEHAK